ncbi:MAG: PEP-CTERM sorting domain-containing protein [Nitrospira sp.]|nr:PEP-CTERM sorting domain-containing protein [Nitrospira sp.]
MIPPHSVIRLRIVCILILTLLAMVPAELLAIQIAPNPNPDGNTITITPSTPGDNSVPFSNQGSINIESQASFHNSSQFNNGSLLPFTFGGAVINSGTIINSSQFINNRTVSILEGARFINLASGFYWNLDGTTHIAGTFINKGAVEHNSYGFTIFETGQYIQRQDSNSSVTPTTVNRDQVFNNAGLVHIATGEFSNRPFGIYSQTGMTQIDAIFHNGGQVYNVGHLTVGTSGLYEHQTENAFPGPGPNPGGLTSNFGTFTNGGTTNIATGVFTNQGSVANSGTFTIGTTGTYSQTSTSAGITPITVNTGTFTNFGTTNINTGIFDNKRGFSNTGTVSIGAGASFTNTDSRFYVPSFYAQPFGATTRIEGNFTNIGEVQNGGVITVSSTGVYSQVAGVSSPSATNNPGTFTNAGQVRIGQGTVFGNAMVEIHPSPSGLYVQQASGTTWIDGSFANSSRVENSGTVSIGTTGHYHQESSPRLLVPPTTVNTGTFTSTGQVRIGERTSFINGTFIAAGTTNINAGVFENNGDFRNNKGQVNIGQGALFSNTRDISSGDGTVSALYLQEVGGRTRIDGGFDNRGSVSNEGTIAVGTTGTYTQSAGGGTRNAVLFQNEGRVSLSGQSSFFNTGQYVQLASGKTEIASMFVNLGGQMSNAGAITIGTTGQYLQDRLPGSSTPVPSTTLNTGTFTNAGQVRIGEGTSFGNFPRLEHGAPPAVGGQYIQQAGGTTQIDGTFSNGGGRVTNEGTITVGATGTYTQTRSAPPVPATPAIVNSGTFANAGNTRVDAGTFTNHGNLVNSGTFQVAVNGVATLINHGTVANYGTFEVGAGVGAVGGVSGTGSYVQNAAAAQTIVNGMFAHNVSLQAGALTGTGTIQGIVQNSGGLLLPGNNGLGTLTIKGQYAQGFGGTFGVILAGLNNYGLLAVQGTGAAVTLNGFLTIGLLNGFSPSLGNTFGVLTCTGCTIRGNLLGLSLPALASGLDWSVRVVDALGTLQLAVVSGPTSSAPEPGTILLVGAGFVALIEWRRRRIKSAQPIRE